MSIEVEHADEIPEGPYETGLWADARYWADHLFGVFDNLKEIAAVGLTRRMALRCKNWLWSIEGMVRRLVIAAAMRLDPALLKTRKALEASSPKPATDQKGPRKSLPAFRIFSIHALPNGEARPSAPRQSQPLHRHLCFPVDDFLRIGANEARRGEKRGSSGRRIHPLDRRGRISRWDPDFRVDLDKAEAENERYFLFGPGRPDEGDITTPPPPPRQRPPRQDRSSPFFCHSSDGLEWRRIDEEWQRVIPAPDLARRILAIARVLEAPQRWIERAARQLQRTAGLSRRLSDIHEPMLVKPKRDPLPLPMGIDTLFACHLSIPQPDTS